MERLKTFKEFINEDVKIQKQSYQDDDFDVLDDTLNKIDLSGLTKKDVKKQFVNFELIQSPSYFGDILFDEVNEDKQISYDIEKVRKEISRRYSLAKWQFQIIDGENDIKVALIIPKIERNEELISNDMQKMGYYESIRYIKSIMGFPYLIIKFDPRYPKTINNIVRSMSCILHLTPKYNLESIEKNGFIPQHKNEVFNYPDRLHFLKGNITEDEIINIGQQLCKTNNNPQNNGLYILFTLDVNLIPKNINFIGDSCYEYGICTENTVPYDCVISKKEIKFRK